jgi:tetratricopeptide (TPR) repeat protein
MKRELAGASEATVMEIPPILKSNILSGNVVLLLGAGASVEAKDTRGRAAPSSKQLTTLIVDKFLSPAFSQYSLSQVAEIAISESDLVTFQEFIREVFEPFEPTEAHDILCSFKWHGLATTNFDRLVEKAYDRHPTRAQNIRPFIDNNDRIDDALRDLKAVLYLKLHGCITRTSNSSAPLILTPDQYVQHQKDRWRVFNTFKEWCCEHIVVFVGSSAQDSDLRQILIELQEDGRSHPKYFMVAPDVPEQIERLWVKKGIDVIRGTFAEFMATLDSTLSSVFRAIPAARTSEDFPVSERFVKTGVTLSEPTKRALSIDLEYVRSVKIGGDVNPQEFYRGADIGWAAIASNLDVKRGLVESILSEHFLEKAHASDGLQFVVVKAHAGAGKKTLLRRIAWDASHDYDCLCLYVKESGSLTSVAISEIADLVNERIFLFVEDAPARLRELAVLLTNMGKRGDSLTIIATARTNEWNVTCQDLSEWVTAEYDLKYLSQKDIAVLLELLDKHHALGTLRYLTPTARADALRERAGRQILVALHEATLGKPFVEIIRDEYENVRPAEAQRMYLSVCVLNRLDIPVRAGIIARMHGITFNDFEKRFFKPLELVVNAKYNKIIRDYEYASRHPHIAEILVEELLAKPEDRFEEYVRCLKYLNLAYDSDRRAFYRMIRANDLLAVFPDHSMVSAIYGFAQETAPHDAEVLHQMAIYEMKRPSGSMDKARQLLEEAHKIAQHNHTIVHSMAELRLHMAQSEGITETEFRKHIRDAEQICRDNARILDSHGLSTLVKVELLKLERMLDSGTDDNSEIELEESIKRTEESLDHALQNYPGEYTFLNLEARLAKLLSDSDRVIRTLAKSFAVNPRNTFVALRLSRCHQERGDMREAREVLKQALNANSNRKELHYAYAKALMKDPDVPPEELEYHFKRAYTPGDRNYDAQLLHARQLYIGGSIEEAKALFETLGTARVPSNLKLQPRYPLNTTCHGEVRRVEASYCWIKRDGTQDWIYCHQESIDISIWRNLLPGTRVTFTIAFNMRGSVAINVAIGESV